MATERRGTVDQLLKVSRGRVSAWVDTLNKRKMVSAPLEREQALLLAGQVAPVSQGGIEIGIADTLERGHTSSMIRNTSVMLTCNILYIACIPSDSVVVECKCVIIMLSRLFSTSLSPRLTNPFYSSSSASPCTNPFRIPILPRLAPPVFVPEEAFLRARSSSSSDSSSEPDPTCRVSSSPDDSVFASEICPAGSAPGSQVS